MRKPDESTDTTKGDKKTNSLSHLVGRLHYPSYSIEIVFGTSRDSVAYSMSDLARTLPNGRMSVKRGMRSCQVGFSTA